MIETSTGDAAIQTMARGVWAVLARLRNSASGEDGPRSSDRRPPREVEETGLRVTEDYQPHGRPPLLWTLCPWRG